MTKLETWYSEKKHEELSELLRNPILIDAIELLREVYLQPDTAVVNGVARDGCAQDAAMRLAILHAQQSGGHGILKSLLQLGQPQKERKRVDVKEPFAHVPDNYFERQLNPELPPVYA